MPTFVVTFGKPESIKNPGADKESWGFPFSIVEALLVGTAKEKPNRKEHRAYISITGSRWKTWRLPEDAIPPLLSAFAREHVRELVNSEALPKDDTYTLKEKLIDTFNYEGACPFEAAAINDIEGEQMKIR